MMGFSHALCGSPLYNQLKSDRQLLRLAVLSQTLEKAQGVSPLMQPTANYSKNSFNPSYKS